MKKLWWYTITIVDTYYVRVFSSLSLTLGPCPKGQKPPKLTILLFVRRLCMEMKKLWWYAIFIADTYYVRVFSSLSLPLGPYPKGQKPQIYDLIVCKETVRENEDVLMVYYFHSGYVLCKSIFKLKPIIGPLPQGTKTPKLTILLFVRRLCMEMEKLWCYAISIADTYYVRVFLSLSLSLGPCPKEQKNPKINDLIVCKETMHGNGKVMMVFYYHSGYVLCKSIFKLEPTIGSLPQGTKTPKLMILLFVRRLCMKMKKVMMVYYYHSGYVLYKSLFKLEPTTGPKPRGPKTPN
jgi:hypothetical protein